MGDKHEQPGKRDVARFKAAEGIDHGGATEGVDQPRSDEADAEGHKRFSRVADGADQPPSDEADVENRGTRKF